MKLENEQLLVEIASLGAEVTRIYDKIQGNEILWEGNPIFWKRHSPILFPNVGKTFQNTVRIGERQYPTSQHGFARDTEFTCVEADACRAEYVMKSDEETRKIYPYDFTLSIIYHLDGKELAVEWKVENTSSKAMYFTIGGHPAFRFAKPDEKKEDYILKFPGKRALTYVLLDLETGTTLEDQTCELELKQESCGLNEEMFARDALVLDKGQIEEVWICHRDGSPYVGMQCKDFPNFGIWSVKGAPFVCLEPWVGRCDSYGFTGDISEKPGINCIRPGDIFTKSYKIVVG